MKKTMIVCLTVFSLAGCVSNNNIETPEQIKQNAEAFAQELETSKDIIKVMEAYRAYEPDGCFAGEGSKRCITAAALAEPEKLDKYNCVDKQNQSDECILYRRNNKHGSEVGYFDYKRFLGKGSRIKNDDMFIMFTKVYEDITDCDKLFNTTTAEKEECRDRQKKYLRLATKQKIACKKFVENKYNKEMQTNALFYSTNIAYFGRSHYDVMESLERSMRNFADKYQCDISGWQADTFE